MKRNQSYRIEEEQIEQLEKIVEHYERGFKLKISKANAIELLIKDKYEHVK